MPSERVNNSDLYTVFCNKFPKERLIFRPSTDSWHFDNCSVTQNELTRLIAFELDAGVHRVGVLLTRAANDARLSAEANILKWLERIEALPGDDSELRRWLRLMERDDTGKMEHECNVQAMKQFIWQVKRGIVKKPAVWQVAPIFWSKEGGTGKSFNIRRIIEPIAAFSRNVNVDELSEKFSGRLFAQTLVAFLDEFAGVEKADVATLKSILTGKPIDRRSMHSESGFYSINRMSCIASTNLAPPHGFIDHTGARRFWSIHCSGERMDGPSPRQEGFDSIDPDKVWAAISVHDRCPHYDPKPGVLVHMERQRNDTLRSRNSLEQFVDDCLEESPDDRVALKELQTAYKSYCSRTRQVPLRGGYRELQRWLRDIGLTVNSPNNRFYLHDHRIAEDPTEFA